MTAVATSFPYRPPTPLRAPRRRLQWAVRALAAGGVLALLAIPLVPVDPGHVGRAAGGVRLAAARIVGQPELQPAAIGDSLLAGSFAIEPARPFIASYGDAASALRAETCLTEAIYYEGALEPELGQRAIAQVVLNRVRHPAWPDNVCGVVFQGQERTTGCQFTFTCDGSRARAPVPSLWARANRIAKAALGGAVASEVGLATHYHADYVMPYWSSSLDPAGQIGRHMFYRWRGSPGQAGAFTMRYAGREPQIPAWAGRIAVPEQPEFQMAAAAAPAAGPTGVNLLSAPRRPLGLAEPAQAADTPAPAPAAAAAAPAPFRARPLNLAAPMGDGPG